MHKKISALIILFIAGSLFSNIVYAQQFNTLTSKEKKEGWQLLFDGKDLKGWHSYLENKPGIDWQVQNGTILLNKNDKSTYKDYADLTSDQEFENFDLKVEWKIESCPSQDMETLKWTPPLSDMPDHLQKQY
ncbi:MAG: DUF1080 domain-containing protein [Bacteroidota bacterium]|nr:DUF1080 domain-containing protein [Bacteroidota bacterium]